MNVAGRHGIASMARRSHDAATACVLAHDGYRHDSIPAGIHALRQLGDQAGCAVDATEDPAAFTDGGLSGYAAVIFLSTSGDVLDDAGRDALRWYMAEGGAWLGIHGAATTETAGPTSAGSPGRGSTGTSASRRRR